MRGDSQMSDEERIDLYRNVIAGWGESRQIDTMIEKMAELTQALIEHRQAINDNVKHDASLKVLEGLADVSIALEQMRLIFGSTTILEDQKLQCLNHDYRWWINTYSA